MSRLDNKPDEQKPGRGVLGGLLAVFQSAVRFFGTGVPDSIPVLRASAIPPKPTHRAEPTLIHDEKIFRLLLQGLFEASTHAQPIYETWEYHATPSDEKRTRSLEKNLEAHEIKRAAQHSARVAALSQTVTKPLPPLRADEAKTVALLSDQSFPIKAKAARAEFIHHLKAFVQHLALAHPNHPPTLKAGYLRAEFAFKPLPATKEMAALTDLARTRYVDLLRSVEAQADLLLRLVPEVLESPVAAPAAPATPVLGPDIPAHPNSILLPVVSTQLDDSPVQSLPPAGTGSAAPAARAA